MSDSKSKHQIEISAVDNATRVIKGIEDKFSSLGKTIDRSLAVIGVAGIAALTGAIKKSINEAASEEKAMKRLSTAIELTGKSYLSVSGQVNTLLKSQQRLTQFADDQSAGALATLVQLTRNYDLSMKALIVTEDLAASGLFDLDSAATAVGKALAGNVMLLQRMGIKLKEGDDVLAVLSARFGGSAVKNVDTFSGRLQQLGNIISESFESLGGPLLEPLKNAFVTLRDTIASEEMQSKIRAFGESIANNIPKAIEKLKDFSSWVIQNGDTILAFFKALLLLRLSSWAIESATAIARLVTSLATLPAWMFSGGAAAFGTFAIGSQLSSAMTSTIKGETDLNKIVSETNTAYQTLRKVQEEVFGKFADYRSGTDKQREAWDNYVNTLYMKVIPAIDVFSVKAGGVKVVIDKVTDSIQKISNWGASIEGSRFGGGRAIIGRRGDRTRDRAGIGMRAGRGRGRLGGGGLFDIDGSGGVGGAETMDIDAILKIIKAEKSYRQFMSTVNTVASYTMQAMSGITQTLVNGIAEGTLRIKDLFNSLKSAILNIISDLLAKLATAGILSLFFPSIGFTGALYGVFGGGFGGGRTQSIMPNPIGAFPTSPQSSFGGMHVTLIVQGDLVNDDEKIRRFIDKGVTQAQRGGNKLSRYLSK